MMYTTNHDDDDDISNDMTDIEALASRALDLSNFTIDDSSISSSEDNMDNITDSSLLTTPTGDDDLCHLSSPGKTDLTALQVRTSEIISTYRDYLSEMQVVSSENARLANEMSNIRNSLGRKSNSKGRGRTKWSGSGAHVHIYEESCRHAGLQKTTQYNTKNKYSQPILHSRVLKKRVLGAIIAIAVIGLSLTFISTKVSNEKKKEFENQQQLPEWNSKLAEQLKGEAEYTGQLQAHEWHENLIQRANTPNDNSSPTTQINLIDPPESKSVAMEMIEKILAQPTEKGNSSNKSGKSNKVPITIKTIGSSKSDKGIATKAPASVSKSIKSTESVNTAGKSTKAPTIGTSKSDKDAITTSAPASASTNSKSSKVMIGDSKSSKSSTRSKAAKTSDGKSHIKVFSIEKMAEKSFETTTTTSSSAIASFSIIEDPITEAQEIKKKQRLHVESAHILYQAISTKYNPIVYARSQGEYGGHTYRDAVIFCAENYPKNEDGYDGVPCNYQAYCPEGPNALPFGGYVNAESRSAGDDGEVYAPIMSVEEHWIGWVQLSKGHSCVAYPALEPEPSIRQTGHLMCCKDV